MAEPAQRLDILYVGTLPPHPGGSAISGSQLILGFTKLGHTVRALAPMTEEALRDGDHFAVSHPEIAITRFRVPYFETAPNHPPPEGYLRIEHEGIEEALPRLIAKKRPDVIFIGRESFAWHVPDIARAAAVPSVLRIAGGATGGILTRAYSDAMARQLLTQFLKINLIITPATHLTDSLRALACDRITTIPNAVDLHQFVPASKDAALLRELGIDDDDVVVMHASNLKAIKRPLDVVHSAERALRCHSKLVYLIVGDGAYRQPMEELCARRCLSDRFRFVGWIEYARFPRYMSLADIVVMPSDSEGLARVYLETQASGRLLLASDIPAAREVIADGETGLLFRPGDIDDLTAKTLTAAADPKLRARIGQQASRRVRANAIEHAIDRYLDAMRSLVTMHRSER
jgi:glycosyltransferase involved in cell wall biosynthesis